VFKQADDLAGRVRDPVYNTRASLAHHLLHTGDRVELLFQTVQGGLLPQIAGGLSFDSYQTCSTSA